MTDIQEPILLESYLYWRNAWRNDAAGIIPTKNKFNGKFPASYQQWLAVIDVCPFHDGATIMRNQYDRNIWCLCKVMEISHKKREEVRDIIQPPPVKYLDAIKPMSMTNNREEITDTANFLKYLETRWIVNPEQFIVHGNVGCGKTTILQALYWQHPLVSLYLPVREMAQFIYDFDTLKEHISALQHYPILLMDDVGAERKTDYVLDLMYNIVDYRYTYREQVVTVISTNELGAMSKSEDIQVQRLYSRYVDGKRFVLSQGDYRKLKVVA